MILVYIHGANSSSASWNYIRQQLKYDGQELLLEYNSDNSFDSNLKDMVKTINKTDQKESLYFVAHSLGGIYALHLSQEFQNRTTGGFTISTPYGGCESANILHIMFPRRQLLNDIAPNSWPMKRISHFIIPKNWTTIITTAGDNPLFLGQHNDGVVTVKSQQELPVIDQVKLAFNHYEILQSTKLIENLNKKIANALKF
jgi:pimeloyl-ACP methyl ester carboxylesterase